MNQAAVDAKTPAVDPAMAELVQSVLLASPVSRALGVRMCALERKRVVLELPFDNGKATCGDVVHGGVIATLIDIARARRRARRCDERVVDQLSRRRKRRRLTRRGVRAAPRPPASGVGRVGLRRRLAGREGAVDERDVLTRTPRGMHRGRRRATRQMTPNASMASARRRKPTMFAPTT